MEKVTKKVLKSVVKECLIEILAEGVFPDERTGTRKLKEAIKIDSNKKRRSLRSLQSETQQEEVVEDSRVRDRKAAIAEAARSITSDPILSEVLADTAQTTLQAQLSADSKTPSVLRSVTGVPGADQAAQIAEASDPSELFGEEASGKWAKLAFNS